MNKFQCAKNVIIAVIGNKADLIGSGTLSLDEARIFVHYNKILRSMIFMAVSVKHGTDVTKALNYIATAVKYVKDRPQLIQQTNPFIPGVEFEQSPWSEERLALRYYNTYQSSFADPEANKTHKNELGLYRLNMLLNDYTYDDLFSEKIAYTQQTYLNTVGMGKEMSIEYIRCFLTSFAALQAAGDYNEEWKVKLESKIDNFAFNQIVRTYMANGLSDNDIDRILRSKLLSNRKCIKIVFFKDIKYQQVQPLPIPSANSIPWLQNKFQAAFLNDHITTDKAEKDATFSMDTLTRLLDQSTQIKKTW